MSPSIPAITEVVVPFPLAHILINGATVGAVKSLILWDKDISNELDDNSHTPILGSTRPVAVSFGNLKSVVQLSIAFGVDSHDFSSGYHVEGKLNDQAIFHGASPNGASTINVDLDAKNPGEPFAYAGDVVWTITSSTTRQTVTFADSTRIEIYAISPDTTQAIFFKKDPIPIQILRKIVYSATAGYVQYLVHTVFTGFGLTYNSHNGGSYLNLAGTGGSYDYEDWVNLDFTNNRIRINCFDLAAIVQTCLPFLIGSVENTWAYLNPFGFINSADLIGWGNCNNPFFRSTDESGVPDAPSQQLVDINRLDPIRSGFKTHAFIILPDADILKRTVIDATSGPHAGTEPFKDYILAGIDTKTNLYSKVAWDENKTTHVTHADPDNISGALKGNSGVTSIYRDHAPPIPISNEVKQVRKAAANQDPTVPKTAKKTPLHALPNATRNAAPQITDVGPSTTHINNGTSRISWQLDIGPSASVSVTVCIFKDDDTAGHALEYQLSTYHYQIDKLFKEDASQVGQYSLQSKDGFEYLWVHNNLFAHIKYSEAKDADRRSTSEVSKITSAVAKQVYDHLASEDVNASNWEKPTILSLGLSGIPEGSVHVDDQFEVIASVKNASEATSAITQYGHVALIRTTPHVPEKSEHVDAHTQVKFLFVAKSHGEETITFSFAHADTLGITSQRVNIKVVNLAFKD